MSETITPTTAQPVPVKVSPGARVALAAMMRRWSGWPNASLILGHPGAVSMFGATDHTTRTFEINVDALSLNPHRVLRTVTPFRLRQEGILTGVMLHEAGHARFSHWRPRTPEQAAAFKHNNGRGAPVEQAALDLAALCEEPRVEAMMARHADLTASTGLTWTMRAAAAVLAPRTQFSDDPDQFVMDVISSWVVRAGRQYALAAHTGHVVADWTHQFTALLRDALKDHLIGVDDAAYENGDTTNLTPVSTRVGEVVTALMEMVAWDGEATAEAVTGSRHMFTDADADTPHTGTFMVDNAQMILNILFPETDEPPSPSGGCGSAGAAGAAGSDEQGEQGEQDDQPEEGGSDGSSEGQGSDESDDQAEGEGQGQGEASGPQSEVSKAIAEALAQAEADAADQGEAQAQAAAESGEAPEGEPKEQRSGQSGGFGNGATKYGWRMPSADDMAMQRSAEAFLRSVIDPTVKSRSVLTESPSTNVDAAAMAAWRAGGQVRDPRFFRRTQRTVEPSTPVRIAVLVDVSLSMSELQEPSALLSWALSNAALDLRNFAGRGTQVESCLIHWGSNAKVIAGNGDVLPGIRTHECNQGTSAMDEAFDLVDREMPGFFDAPDVPAHRLLVQFTDWQLVGTLVEAITPRIEAAAANGVHSLTVVPRRWSQHASGYDQIMRGARVPDDKQTAIRFDPKAPAAVWTQAAKILNQ